MRSILDEATDPWGIKVNRVEVKNILPPKDIQEAMEKQMRAERERRRAILEAEGSKKAQVLEAEGRKEAAILDAEAKKRAKILDAEGRKEAEIREAEGHAEAIRQVQKATADGIEFIKQSDPSQAVLALKSFEALTRVADGQATKLIIPSELQNVGSLVASITEVAKTTKA
jgi:regulator of protease activity HflC (stomatin/prohibitin superfamily)